MTAIPQKSFDTASAWKGSTIKNTDKWLYRMDDAEISELKKALVIARATNKNAIDIKKSEFPLDNMVVVIDSWKNQLKDGLGFIQIKGWPADQFTEAENSIVYWGIGLYLGQAVAQNTDGDLLGHVKDTGASPDDPSVRLYKTRVRQDFHADGSDIIGLMCLHPSRTGGESELVSSVSIFNEVLARRPDLAPLMFEDFFFDMHEQQSEGQKPYWVMPISTYTNGSIRTWFAEWYIRMAQRHEDVPSLSKAQDELINLIVEIANDPEFKIDIDFEIGDMQFLKNSAILHARGEYEDYEDPARKRHLLRLWLARPDFADGIESLRDGIKRKRA